MALAKKTNKNKMHREEDLEVILGIRSLRCILS